jgi:AraC-like DNA-binding protein
MLKSARLPVAPSASVAELVELVRARAPHEGKMASALPGVFLCRYDATRPPARNRSSAMWVCLAVQGRKRMRIGELELCYDPLSYLVLRGETEFEAQPVEASRQKPYLAIVLSLAPQLVSQALLEVAQAGHALPMEDAAPEPAFTAPLDAALIDGMSRLLRTLDDPLERRLIGPLVVRELVLRLMLTHAARIMRHNALTQAEREPIRRAMDYIEARACERLTVEAVARHIGMSPSHFAHRFSEIASVSPMRYQKHVRLERARELLLGSSERASTIAERVGYASAAHFTRDFKRQFGLSPGSYARAFDRHAAAFAAVESGAHAVEVEPGTAGSSKKNAGLALGALAIGR